MKSQITIYLMLVLVVFGLGYIGFALYAKNDNDSIAEPVPKPEETPLNQPAPPRGQSLQVKTVEGVVERSSVAENNWTKVFPGNELYADEKLRTEKNSSVRLQADDNSRIEMEGRSEIAIQDINDTVHRIKLELGQLNVDYKTSNNRRLKITSDSKSGEAETKAGRFVVQKNDGRLSVATEKGEVTLSAGGESVEVEAGTISYVLDGKAPSKPEPIPLSVMLRVANPRKRKQAETKTTIRGRTDVSARVHVNDIPATVDKRGRFQVTIPLEQGKNPIEVVARTAYGSAEKTLPSVVVSNSVYNNNREASPTVDSAEVRWGKLRKRQKHRPSNDSQNP